MITTIEPAPTEVIVIPKPQMLFCQCGCARCAKYDHWLSRR